MVSAEDRTLQRLLDFELDYEAEVCEEVREVEGGRAFLNPSLNLIWDANSLVIERGGLSDMQVTALADEVLGGAGFPHRTIAFRDPREGERLAAGFEAMRWHVERSVYMVWRGSGPPSARTAHSRDGQAHEARLREIEPLRRELIREGLDMGVDTTEAVEQLLEWDRRLARVVGDRWFTARHGDSPSAACRLMARNGIGQVEEVATARRARELGLGKAVTLAALRASLADGNEVTYLGALADDWPRLMYERLGFEPVGLSFTFRRKPDAWDNRSP